MKLQDYFNETTGFTIIIQLHDWEYLPLPHFTSRIPEFLPNSDTSITSKMESAYVAISMKFVRLRT